MGWVGAEVAEVGGGGNGEGGGEGREQLICFRATGSGLRSALWHQRRLGDVCRTRWNIMEIVSPAGSRSRRRVSPGPLFLSLKGKLSEQINTNYGHTFLLNALHQP